MNQFFSIERFSLLVAKHWADNQRRYTLTVLAFMGLLSAWFLVSLFMQEGVGPMSFDLQHITFLFLLFNTTALYASQFYGELSSRTKAGNFLLTPTSSFEKLLCGIFFTGVVFPLVFFAAFFLVDSLMVALANTAFKAAREAKVINVFSRDFFYFNPEESIGFLPFLFPVQSIFLLGSIYFRKYNYIKTVISFFILLAIIMGLLLAVNTWIIDLDTFFPIYMPDRTKAIFSLVPFLIALILWWVAYYRMKAKQV